MTLTEVLSSNVKVVDLFGDGEFLKGIEDRRMTVCIEFPVFNRKNRFFHIEPMEMDSLEEVVDYCELSLEMFYDDQARDFIPRDVAPDFVISMTLSFPNHEFVIDHRQFIKKMAKNNVED
jgi:hypothetical protein